MENARVSEPGSARIEHVQRLLAEQGRDLGFAGVRVAAGKSGIAVGFRGDSMLHLSWWALSAFALGVALVRLARR